jgi:hypothetical protein
VHCRDAKWFVLTLVILGLSLAVTVVRRTCPTGAVFRIEPTGQQAPATDADVSIDLRDDGVEPLPGTWLA